MTRKYKPNKKRPHEYTRYIGDYLFRGHSFHLTKSNAQREANKLRKMGKKARVVRLTKRRGYKQYIVFKKIRVNPPGRIWGGGRKWQ